MKKLFAVSVIFALIFTACDTGNDSGNSNTGETETPGTTLTIKNESFSDISNVTWQSVSFGLIRAGGSVTKDVPASSGGYIRFRRTVNPINARTSEIVVISDGESREVGFSDNTPVVDNDKPERTGTLRTLQPESVSFQIGDTGPGGIIFFAESGQFKEVSGELGSYTWDDAVTRATNHRGGGFTNWRLPDRAELELIYNNLHRQGFGGFRDEWHWSSYMTTDTTAQALSFRDGSRIIYSSKGNISAVRAVRDF